jgi:hypothetical protein
VRPNHQHSVSTPADAINTIDSPAFPLPLPASIVDTLRTLPTGFFRPSDDEAEFAASTSAMETEGDASSSMERITFYEGEGGAGGGQGVGGGSRRGEFSLEFSGGHSDMRHINLQQLRQVLEKEVAGGEGAATANGDMQLPWKMLPRAPRASHTEQHASHTEQHASSGRTATLRNLRERLPLPLFSPLFEAHLTAYGVDAGVRALLPRVHLVAVHVHHLMRPVHHLMRPGSPSRRGASQKAKGRLEQKQRMVEMRTEFMHEQDSVHAAPSSTRSSQSHRENAARTPLMGAGKMRAVDGSR